MKSSLRSFVSVLPLLLAFGVLPAALPAQIALSFTGTANATTSGFTLGQSATFTFLISDGYAQGASDEFTVQMVWFEDANSSAPLFAAVSGDGPAGTWAPTNPGYYTYLNVANPGYLELYGLDATGLLLNGTPVTTIQAGLNNIPGINFLAAGSYVGPATYMADYLGDYAAGGSDYVEFGGTGLNFSLTGFSIAAIPEPSTYAMWVGVLALAFAARRRRR